MIIGVDIRIFAGGQRSGVQEYAEQVLSRMVRMAPEHQFKFFFSSLRSSPPLYDWLSAPNAKLYHYRIPNNVLFAAGRLFNRPSLDRLMGGADIFFSPHFFLAPISKSCRRVTTFHDLSYVRFTQFFTYRKLLWHALMHPARTARFSDQIIAVSESTKADLVEKYKIDPAHINTIYSGSSFVRPSTEVLDQFRKNHNLPDRFIFSLATLEPRKNITGVIKAFNILKEDSAFDDLHLIIAGSRGWLYEDTMREIDSSPYKKDISYIGYIDNNRAMYYSLASLILYPSFFEGFGLPIVEAMSCGTPVVTSHNSSMAEIADDAALLVDPYNVSDIASAARLVLESNTVRSRLVEKGNHRIKQFDWDLCANRTLATIIGHSSTAS